MRHDAADYYYHTRVRRGPPGCTTRLIVGGEAFDNHTVPEDESLSLTLTGTNGQLPRRAAEHRARYGDENHFRQYCSA